MLLEIGTEELPPGALERLRQAFRDGLRERLESAGVPFAGAVESFATPRRLAVRVAQVGPRQPDRSFERLGPKVEAAFDAEGRATKAAEGFARSAGVTVDELARVDTEKGARVVARGVEPGRPLDELLPELVDATLEGLPIPKRMRWGSGERAFVRPVHWVVALHGERVIEKEVFGVIAGRRTQGHRFHHGGWLELRKPGDYERALEADGWVVVDPQERRQRIATQVREQAQAAGGEADLDEGLLDEVNALVEWPVALWGSFDPGFLEVAEEALVSSMQGHQRCFPVRDASGRLLPVFVAVANLQSRKLEEVRRGNERVIRPRLADAQFFWHQDQARPLADRLEELDEVLFHRALGSMRARSLRLERGARSWLQRVGSGDAAAAARAGLLAKCDLVTEMVGEFPELQGIMGGHYARRSGESEGVAQAIREHYRPAFSGDSLPSTAEGIAVSVADRIDTLVGIFGADGAPSGDKDPFALRRAALGLVRCILESGVGGNLREGIEAAAEAYREQGVALAEVAKPVLEFCRERLKGYFAEQGFRAEVLQAVEDFPVENPADLARRVEACHAFLSRPEAGALVSAHKRISNILRQAEQRGEAAAAGIPGFASDAPDAERALGEALRAVKERVQESTAKGDYHTALMELAGLRPAVDGFFDGVMVMDPDPGVRARRLGLLRTLRDLFLGVADISRLPGPE